LLSDPNMAVVPLALGRQHPENPDIAVVVLELFISQVRVDRVSDGPFVLAVSRGAAFSQSAPARSLMGASTTSFDESAGAVSHSQPRYSTDVLISTHCAQSLSRAPLKINGTF
jgi:hypothetical protein